MLVFEESTSLQAWESLDTEGLRQQILTAFRVHGPLTCDEIEVLMKMRHQTASARISELKKAGKLLDTGARRPTRSGRLATVLQARPRKIRSAWHNRISTQLREKLPVYVPQDRPKPPAPGTYKTEQHRVVQVPERTYLGADLTAELAKPGALPFTDPSGATIKALNAEQSAALEAIRDAQGGLIIVGVGGGKAGVALLAGTVLDDVKCVLVLTPATTVPQLNMTLASWGQRFHMVEHIRILSYHDLSQPRSDDQPPLLEELTAGYKPHEIAIVADECHRLKNKTAARTQRVSRFYEEHPEVSFVGLSGTITKKTLKDFGHLAEWATRDLSPLPRDNQTLIAWAECLDVKGKPGPVHWAVLEPLLVRYDVDVDLPPVRLIPEARKAFQRRLKTAPGIHASERTSVDCSLTMHALRPEVPEEIQGLIRDIKELDCDADGVPFPDDVSRWRTMREVSMGFFYRRQWPEGCERCGVQVPIWTPGSPCRKGGIHGAKPDFIPDHEWLDARSTWHGAIRRELETKARHGYDSPKLIEEAVKNQQVTDPYLIRCYLKWQEQNVKRWNGRPEPPTVPVWINYFLVEEARKWLKREKRPTIIWYESRALQEALDRAGFVVYGAGDSPPSHKAHTCAMSIRAQGEGLNLQRWSCNLVLEPPSGAGTWEQVLGRTHRSGQQADEVDVYVYQHTESFESAMWSAFKGARYIQDTTGNQQRLNVCTRNGWGAFG
jgi:hypothetical protein